MRAAAGSATACNRAAVSHGASVSFIISLVVAFPRYAANRRPSPTTAPGPEDAGAVDVGEDGGPAGCGALLPGPRRRTPRVAAPHGQGGHARWLDPCRVQPVAQHQVCDGWRRGRRVCCLCTCGGQPRGAALAAGFSTRSVVRHWLPAPANGVWVRHWLPASANGGLWQRGDAQGGSWVKFAVFAAAEKCPGGKGGKSKVTVNWQGPRRGHYRHTAMHLSALGSTTLTRRP